MIVREPGALLALVKLRGLQVGDRVVFRQRSSVTNSNEKYEDHSLNVDQIRSIYDYYDAPESLWFWDIIEWERPSSNKENP